MLPITLKVSDRPCLVVGGGVIAERKVEALLAAGAEVTVASPTLTDKLSLLAERGEISAMMGSYEASLLGSHSLIVAATDDAQLNERIAADAAGSRRLVNVVDQPDVCDFFFPAVVRRGPLTLAVSTDGLCPALSAAVRSKLEAMYGPEYEALTVLLGEVRALLRKSVLDKKTRDEILASIVASDLIDRVRAGETPTPETIVREFENEKI